MRIAPCDHRIGQRTPPGSAQGVSSSARRRRGLVRWHRDESGSATLEQVLASGWVLACAATILPLAIDLLRQWCYRTTVTVSLPIG
jgi:hypothetical protein